MRSPRHALATAIVCSLVLGACAPGPAPDADAARSVAPAAEAADVAVVTEAFLTAMTPEDNIDSPAAWAAPDGRVWVFSTAKSTDRLVVYDGDDGRTLRSIGSTGDAPGEFRRPNGVFVIDDLLFVVERDGHRVQVFDLPGLAPLAAFGSDELIKPYGLWVNAVDGGYDLYVTDFYHGPDKAVPPLAELDRRIKRYRIERSGEALEARFEGAFGDTSEAGALRVVESIWGDPVHDRLLIAEEDEAWANEFKVYDLAGRFTGTVFGGEQLEAQAEGIALYTCDDGRGYWITTAQGKDQTRFHLFDRRDLSHVGAFQGARVANTDGIWLHQSATTQFPRGAFYAVHDDQGLVGFDWRDIARALSLPSDCGG